MTETAKRVMVPGYRHVPGHHCGSTALRNLLGFHGVEISEEMAFGLGAGACFYYVVLDGTVALAVHQRPRGPPRGELPRAHRQRPCGCAPTTIPNAAWALAREAVDDGPPGAAAHRPLLPRPLRPLGPLPRPRGGPRRLRRGARLALRHRLRGPADDLAREPRRGAALEAADLPARGAHGRPPRGRASSTRPTSARTLPAAIERAAKEMLEPALGDFQGLPALRRFAAEVGDWPEAAEDWQWCARFLYQVIERRGTGGGNFRRMYSRFLEEAGYEESALAARGRRALDRAGDRRPRGQRARRGRPGALGGARRRGRPRVLEAEERLWTSWPRAADSGLREASEVAERVSRRVARR